MDDRALFIAAPLVLRPTWLSPVALDPVLRLQALRAFPPTGCRESSPACLRILVIPITSLSTIFFSRARSPIFRAPFLFHPVARAIAVTRFQADAARQRLIFPAGTFAS
jgi:hypothetical protein